jgi:hypothetical protein
VGHDVLIDGSIPLIGVFGAFSRLTRVNAHGGKRLNAAIHSRAIALAQSPRKMIF